MKKNSPGDCFLAKVAKSGTETQSVWVDEQERREATVSLKIHQREGRQKVSFFVGGSFLACRQDGFKHRTGARFHLAGTLGLRNNSPDCCVKRPRLKITNVKDTKRCPKRYPFRHLFLFGFFDDKNQRGSTPHTDAGGRMYYLETIS